MYPLSVFAQSKELGKHPTAERMCCSMGRTGTNGLPASIPSRSAPWTGIKPIKNFGIGFVYRLYQTREGIKAAEVESVRLSVANRRTMDSRVFIVLRTTRSCQLHQVWQSDIWLTLWHSTTCCGTSRWHWQS